VDVVRGLQDGVRREDSGGGALGRLPIGLLDAVRMVRVLRLVGERLSSAARRTGTGNGRGGGSDLGETRKRQRRSGRVGVPHQTGFRGVLGQPGRQPSNGDNDYYCYFLLSLLRLLILRSYTIGMRVPRDKDINCRDVTACKY